MTVLAFHDEVVRFLAEAQVGVQVPSPPWAALLSKGEVGFAVHVDGEVLVAEWSSRGVSDGVRIVTRRLDVLERFVVVSFASDWRSSNDLVRVSTWGGPAFMPLGVGVVAHEGGFAVTVASEREPVAWGLTEADAARLARVVAYPIVEIVSSIRQPDGGPIFRIVLGRS